MNSYYGPSHGTQVMRHLLEDIDAERAGLPETHLARHREHCFTCQRDLEREKKARLEALLLRIIDS